MPDLTLTGTPASSAAAFCKIGDGFAARRIGLGAMRLTPAPGSRSKRVSRLAALTLLREAVRLGVNLIDTAACYGDGLNETLIAEALYPYPDDLIIVTKIGLDIRSSGEVVVDNSFPALRASSEESLRRLQVDCIPLCMLHRIDPAAPFKQTVETLAKLRDMKLVREVGLSNVSLEQLEVARRTLPVVAVENRYNVIHHADDALVDYCAKWGIAYMAWAPLAGDPMRRGAPLGARAGLLQALADTYGLTPAQVALLWLLRRSPNIVPIPGTVSRAHLLENLQALEIFCQVD